MDGMSEASMPAMKDMDMSGMKDGDMSAMSPRFVFGIWVWH
jgi:hypothetical protein